MHVKHLTGHDLRRAKALADAAGRAGDPHSVPAGTYLEVHVADLPTSAAAAVVQRVSESLQVCARDSSCLHAWGVPKALLCNCSYCSFLIFCKEWLAYGHPSWRKIRTALIDHSSACTVPWPLLIWLLNVD